MRAEAAAVKARLESNRFSLPVYTTLVDKDGNPIRGNYYVLFHGGPDEVNDDRLTKGQDPDSDRLFVYTVRCVAVTDEFVDDMSAEAFSLLLNWAPVVSGRVCSTVRHAGSDPVKADTAVLPPLYFGDDEYELDSRRA